MYILEQITKTLFQNMMYKWNTDNDNNNRNNNNDDHNNKNDTTKIALSCLAKVVDGNGSGTNTHPHNIKHFALVTGITLLLFFYIETNAKILYDKGFVKVVAEIMDSNLDNVELCMDSSLIIGSVEKCLTTEHNFTPLYADLKGFDLILSALRNHTHNAIICENMTRVLSSLFANSEGQSEMRKKDFIDADGINTINSVLDRHCEKRNIVIHCVSVLKEISSMKGKGKKAHSRYLICVLMQRATRTFALLTTTN